MADTYDTEPPEHEGEHDADRSHEQRGVSEPPSDYEFADESGATADVEHSEETPLSEEPSPRRSPLLPIAAAIGGFLLLGVAAWWQFGNHSTETPPFAGNNAPMAAIAPMPAGHPALPSAAAVAPRVGMVTPQMEITDGSSSPALPSDGAKVVPASPSSATPAAVPASVYSAPVVAAPVPITPAAVPATGNAGAPRVDELAARVDSLQKALDQVNQQLGQVTNMVAATASSQGAATPAVPKDVQDRLDRLEQQLADLHSAAPPLSAPPATAVSESGSIEPVAPSPKRAVASHARKHKEHHKAAHKHTSKAPQEAELAPTWVLRAATPGHAWVASSAVSHDLKPLQVGDTLAGIGRVTSIEQKDGSWVVHGTAGSVQ